MRTPFISAFSPEVPEASRGRVGGIHPDIYASDELAGKAHIVVLEEDDLPEELGQAADLEDVLDEALTTTIGGVCLSCEEELYGVLGVIDDTLQTLEVGEEEVRTLVGSERRPKPMIRALGLIPSRTDTVVSGLPLLRIHFSP